MSEIVVGVDGSDASQRALDWALAEAGMRGTPLAVVHAWEPPSVPPPDLGVLGGRGAAVDLAALRESAQEQAQDLLAGVLASASGPQEGVEVRPRLGEGPPSEVLLAAATAADLLVLGSHGHRPLAALVLGSVSHECLRRAACPVVVVPPERAAKNG